MKIKNLKNYGIPSYILNIWKEHHSPYLLPVQEEAVKKYGILDYDGSRGLPRRDAPRNDKKGARNDNTNLLVIAPTSSGKTFIGEMAAITQVILEQKTIYLVPLKSLAQEKYKHFKNLYSRCGLEIVTSSLDYKEDDDKIIKGNYNIAIIVYEKFHYFLFKYPDFLAEVSLIIVDELQMINDPGRGPLLESMINHLKIKEKNRKIIALSTPLENQEAVLKWFSAKALLSHHRPIELRKGIVREGTFKYITYNEKTTIGKEVFFKPDTVQDNCFEDYLLETVRYFAEYNESTLIFFPTCAESRRWSKWLASQLNSPAASSAIKELSRMEETLSRNELLELLKKGTAYHNADLSPEERNLIEKYIRKGEIKIICATTTLAIGVDLPFKNVIIASNKMYGNDRDYSHTYQKTLTLADIENIGGRAGRLNRGKSKNFLEREKEFGRVIFLAPSLISETILQKLYFNSTNQVNKYPVKKEKDLLTFLLKLIVTCNQDSRDKIRKYLKKVGTSSSQSSPEEENNIYNYWRFHFEEDENMEQEIDKYLDILVENKLIRKNKKGNFSPTTCGILIITKAIKVETYLYFKSWIKDSKKGEISNLEILLFLSLSLDGKELPIPFSLSCINDCKRERHNCEQEEIYRNRILRLICNQGEEDKKFYQDKLILKKDEERVFNLENCLAFKKTLLLYDWIGSKKVKSLEEEYNIYRGSIKHLAESFSWLAESLANLAEITNWKDEREEDLKKIRLLSERLIKEVKEEELELAHPHIEICKPKSENSHLQPEPILQIDNHRPDRIIFLGKEVKLTPLAFSLVYLLAQNLGKVLSYNNLLDTLWSEDDDDATYVQISFHLSKIRRAILTTIGNNQINKERVKNIFKVVSRRGLMLNLEIEKLKLI